MSDPGGDEAAVPRWKTCGHDPGGVADYSGCIEGVWYDTCSSPECGGMCEAVRDCMCEGCPSPDCCMTSTGPERS